MKCGIIRDLLPSYIDGLTSLESNDAIETHLEQCSDCRQYYQEMTGEMPEFLPKADAGEVDLLRGVKKHIHMRQVLILLGAAAAIIVIAVVLTQVEFYSGMDETNLTGLYELSNGDLYVEVTAPPGLHRLVTSDLSAMGDYEAAEANFYSYYTLWDRISYNGAADDAASFDMIIYRSRTLSEDGVNSTFEGISFGREGEKDYHWVWKEGDPIEKASPLIEKKAEELYEWDGRSTDSVIIKYEIIQ